MLLLLRSRKIRIPTGVDGRILRCGNAVIPTGLITRLMLAVVLVEMPVERGRARGGICRGIQQCVSIAYPMVVIDGSVYGRISTSSCSQGEVIVADTMCTRCGVVVIVTV